MAILKDLSESSKRAYDSVINKFRVIFNAKDNSFLLDSKKVIEHIKSMDVKLHTKKNYYIAIYSVLARDTTGKFDGVLDYYKNAMNEYNKKQSEIYESQEMSADDAEKFLSWTEILKVREKLDSAADNYFSFQDYLIVCLYTYNNPVRLDYANMTVSKTEKAGKNNLLVWNDKECYFLFREYKTARKYGDVRIKVSEDLKKVLEQLKRYRDIYNEPFLLNRNKKGMSASVLGQTIIRIFKKYTDKAVGIDMIRRAFVCNYREGEKSIKDQKAVANSMLHSIGVNQTVYRKI